MTDTTNLIFAGVGGQGVLLAAQLTAQAAAQAGFDVKQTEVHGVSQRGGSVESHVRYGREVFSPLVMPGQADVVFGLEKLEALRFAHYLRLGQADLESGGVLLVNDHEIIPASVAGAADQYPHQALAVLQAKPIRVMAAPASQRARELGDGRMANIVLLGALSALLDIREEAWAETLRDGIPARHLPANLRAFHSGRQWAAQCGGADEPVRPASKDRVAG